MLTGVITSPPTLRLLVSSELVTMDMSFSRNILINGYSYKSRHVREAIRALPIFMLNQWFG